MGAMMSSVYFRDKTFVEDLNQSVVNIVTIPVF